VYAGIAFRPELGPWLATLPPDVACLELTVDQAVAGSRTRSHYGGYAWPVVVNATHLSLGGPELLDAVELRRAMHAANAVQAVWISAYLGRRHRPEADLSYPQPVCPVRSTLGRVITNCRRLMDACGRPLLVENVAAFGRVEDSMSEAEFINQLCDETGCGVVIDVTALTLDARFGFAPTDWLWAVNPCHVAAVHLGGWAHRPAGRWAWRHEGRVPEEAWALARELVSRTAARTAILQRDGRYLGIADLQQELGRIAALRPAPCLAVARRQLPLAVS
jgi:uncharacterized protein (UPF0276 family)